MPLLDSELDNSRRRVNRMLMDTIHTIELIEENAEIFGEHSNQIRAAINEYLDDFIRKTETSGETHPEALIFDASKENLQRAGFYGAQLDLKERQVTEANEDVRQSLTERARAIFRSPFKKWVDRINNFLSSLIPAAGIGEALKELKDCLRDELPDED